MRVCEGKEFLSSYCSIIRLVGVVAYSYPSLDGFCCSIWFVSEIHLRWVCDRNLACLLNALGGGGVVNKISVNNTYMLCKAN